MITLTAASGTGLFSTIPGRHYILSTTGPISPKTKIKSSYSLSGSASGTFNGYIMWDGNFSEPLYAPGGTLKVELVNPVAYDGVNVELVASSS